MAITKARSSSPVRGYYVTTINTGRIVQTSGAGGFGLPRLGGLIYAQVDGLTGGSSGVARFAAQPHGLEASRAVKQHEEKLAVKEHEQWEKDTKEKAKVEAEEAKKKVEFDKKLAEQQPKKVETPKTVEIVKDPVTNVSKPVAKDNAPAADLDDPKKLKTEEKK